MPQNDAKPPQMNKGTCPGCGRCNTCGRGPEPVYVIPPYQPSPILPYYPWRYYPYAGSDIGYTPAGNGLDVTVTSQTVNLDSVSILALS